MTVSFVKFRNSEEASLVISNDGVSIRAENESKLEGNKTQVRTQSAMINLTRIDFVWFDRDFMKFNYLKQ